MSSILTYGTILDQGLSDTARDSSPGSNGKARPLPKYVYTQRLRGRIYYRFRHGGGQATRLPDDPNSPEFRAAYASALAAGPKRPKTLLASIGRYVIGDALPRAKERARAYGLAFDLTKPFIMDMLESQHHRCAISGVAFDLHRTGARTVTSRLPFRPSIDRIEPAKGYVMGNVRILCFAANMAIADWGDDVFLEICRSTMAKARKRIEG